MGDDVSNRRVQLTQEAAIDMEAQAYQKYSTMKTRKTSDYVENFQPLCRPLSNNNGELNAIRVYFTWTVVLNFLVVTGSSSGNQPVRRNSSTNNNLPQALPPPPTGSKYNHMSDNVVIA